MTTNSAPRVEARLHNGMQTMSYAVLGLVSILTGIFPLASHGESGEADADIPNILVTEQRDEQSKNVVASKIALPASDLPISAESLDAEVIKRMGFRSLDPLLQAATSATPTPSDGAAFNEILLRGFADAPIYRNGINDSNAQLPIRSLANISHIEVLKGPSGALYGPGEPGGSINFVTKRPERTAATEFSLGFGSYSDFSFQLDSTGPLSLANEVDYRFIARREQGDSFRDFVKRDRLFLNPMIAWNLNEDVRFDAAFEYVSDERLLDSGVISVKNALPISRSRFLGEPASETTEIDGYTFQLSSLINIKPGWVLDLSLNGQKSLIDGDLVEPDELESTSDGFLLHRSATQAKEESHVLIAQAELTTEQQAWNVPHHLLFGLSVTGVNENSFFSASDAEDDPFSINPFAPVYGSELPTGQIERDSSEQTRQFSVYVQDLLRLGDRWRLLLGLRYDHIDQSGSDEATPSRFDRASDELSPRIGIVYKPKASWSWFATYSRSVEPNEGLRPDGSGLAPTDGEAVEAGLKWQSERLPLSVDSSIYTIRQTNVTTDAPGNPGFELQTGEQESIGFDLELRTQPARWLSLTARYNFVDAQILNDGIVRNGTTPLNVAKHQIGAIGLIRGSLLKPDDLSIGLSLNYLSDRQGSLEPEELSLKLPGYFRGDIFIAWKYSNRLQLEFGLENFTDEEYIRGSQSDSLHLTPGAPITARGQITLAF